MPTINFNYDVFLSYSSKDAKVVEELGLRLRSNGCTVWAYAMQMRAADNIKDVIFEAMRSSRKIVTVHSKNGKGSRWLMLEQIIAEYLAKMGKDKQRWFAIRLDDSSLPKGLAERHALNWTERTQGHFQEILAACKPAEPDSLNVLRNYGLQNAFLVKDSQMYRARQKEVERMISEERRRLEPRFRLVASSGESFLPPKDEKRGPRLWEKGLKKAIEKRAKFQVVLQAIDSDFAVARALANGVTEKNAQEKHLWRNLPLEDLAEISSKGIVKIRVTDLPVNCSMFFTSKAVMLDPYLWSLEENAPVINKKATENHFWVFQFEGKSDSYDALEKHFDFLFQHGAPFEEVYARFSESLGCFTDRLKKRRRI